MSLIDRVNALLAEVVAEEVIGRFRALEAGDIVAKATPGDPDDIVTIVDRVVERRLATALAGLVPGSVVVGEEACHEDHSLLGALSGASPVWLVDPIDGTKSFARGEDGFGVMIALVEAGATRAAWIALPARNQIFVAEEGSGAFLDGERVRLPAATGFPGAGPRGTLYTRFMPPALATAAERAAAGRYRPLIATGAAAIEYTAIVQGEKDFVVYYRLQPWDHAPGALLLGEAGGCVEHMDGQPYRPASSSQPTIVASGPATCAAVRDWLAAAVRSTG